jgi:hypothetical protein
LRADRIITTHLAGPHNCRRLSRSDDSSFGRWHHGHVRYKYSALAGKVTVRWADNGLFAIVTTEPDARKKIPEMFGIRIIKGGDQ